MGTSNASAQGCPPGNTQAVELGHVGQPAGPVDLGVLAASFQVYVGASTGEMFLLLTKS